MEESSGELFPVLREIPGLAEAVPGFAAETWYGLMAPAGTPRRIILKLNAEIARFLKDPGVAQKLSAEGFIVVADSPQDFARYIQSELTKWRTVIKEIGIRAD